MPNFRMWPGMHLEVLEDTGELKKGQIVQVIYCGGLRGTMITFVGVYGYFPMSGKLFKPIYKRQTEPCSPKK